MSESSSVGHTRVFNEQSCFGKRLITMWFLQNEEKLKSNQTNKVQLMYLDNF